MLSAEEAARAFVDVAEGLVDDFDLVHSLHDLTVHVSRATMNSFVGLLLLDENQDMVHVAASSQDAELLERVQLQHHEGPCLDCVRTGQLQVAAPLEDFVDRWPTFARNALDAHVQSVYAFPMRLREQVIGAINIFGTNPSAIEPADLPIIQGLADLSTITLLQAQSLKRAELLTQQLQFALNSRVVIEQAKGAIARSLDVDVDTAFALLRERARAGKVRLTDLSRQVIDERQTMALFKKPHT